MWNRQCFNIKLERVTERGRLRLSPSEVIDVRLGRSKNQFIHINITFHFQWTRWIISSSKCTFTKFDGIQMWKIYYSFIQIIQILDITVDKDPRNVSKPNAMEFKLGRSIHYNIISILPLTSNEEYLKLFGAIMIVDNLGRFLNSNNPP